MMAAGRISGEAAAGRAGKAKPSPGSKKANKIEAKNVFKEKARNAKKNNEGKGDPDSSPQLEEFTTQTTSLLNAKKDLFNSVEIKNSKLDFKQAEGELKQAEGDLTTINKELMDPTLTPEVKLQKTQIKEVAEATFKEAKKKFENAQDKVKEVNTNTKERLAEIDAKQRKLIEDNPEIYRKATGKDIELAGKPNMKGQTPTSIAIREYFKTGESVIGEIKAAAEANPGSPEAQGKWNRVKKAFSKLSIGGTYTKIGAVLVILGLGAALAIFITKKDGDESSVALGGACYQTFSKDPTITGAVFVNCGQNECNCSSNSKCLSPKCDSTEGKARGVAYTWLTNPPANISPTEAVNALGDALNEALKETSPSPSSSTSIMTIIIYAVIIAFVCAAAFIGYKIYLKRRGVQPITQNFTFNRRTKHKKY